MSKPNTPVKFTNVKSDKDVVYWCGYEGQLSWAKKHLDGLKSYLGEDGAKMQIMWENDDPCMYWGW